MSVDFSRPLRLSDFEHSIVEVLSSDMGGAYPYALRFRATAFEPWLLGRFSPEGFSKDSTSYDVINKSWYPAEGEIVYYPLPATKRVLWRTWGLSSIYDDALWNAGFVFATRPLAEDALARFVEFFKRVPHSEGDLK